MKEEEKIHALTVLEDFDFTIQEYASDNGFTLVEKAVALFSADSNNPEVCPDMHNFIARQIERKYNLKISTNTFLTIDAESGNIRCLVEGQSVNGKIKFSPKEITVSLIHAGVTKSLKSVILPFSSMRYTEGPFPGSEINEKGIRCANELLRKLYYQQRYSRE